MPIYEYQCQSCGERREVLQRISDPPLETCDECGGDVRKLISAPAFQFKGSGWYVTDYARKGEAGGAEKAASNGGADGEKSTESKSAETDSSTSSSSKAESTSVKSATTSA